MTSTASEVPFISFEAEEEKPKDYYYEDDEGSLLLCAHNDGDDDDQDEMIRRETKVKVNRLLSNFKKQLQVDQDESDLQFKNMLAEKRRMLHLALYRNQLNSESNGYGPAENTNIHMVNSSGAADGISPQRNKSLMDAALEEESQTTVSTSFSELPVATEVVADGGDETVVSEITFDLFSSPLTSSSNNNSVLTTINGDNEATMALKSSLEETQKQLDRQQQRISNNLPPSPTKNNSFLNLSAQQKASLSNPTALSRNISYTSSVGSGGSNAVSDFTPVVANHSRSGPIDVDAEAEANVLELEGELRSKYRSPSNEIFRKRHFVAREKLAQGGRSQVKFVAENTYPTSNNNRRLKTFESARNTKFLNDLAFDHFENGEYRQSLEIFEEIVRIHLVHNDKTRVTTAYHNVASCQFKLQNYRLATICLEKVLKNTEEGNSESAEIYGQLGLCQFRNGKFVDALSSYKTCLRLMENNAKIKKKDEESKTLSKIFNNMGCIYFEISQLSEAKVCFGRSYQLLWKIYNECDESQQSSILLNMASTLANMAAIDFRLNNYNDSLSQMHEVLQIRLVVLGQSHADVISAAKSLDELDAQVKRLKLNQYNTSCKAGGVNLRCGGYSKSCRSVYSSDGASVLSMDTEALLETYKGRRHSGGCAGVTSLFQKQKKSQKKSNRLWGHLKSIHASQSAGLTNVNLLRSPNNHEDGSSLHSSNNHYYVSSDESSVEDELGIESKASF